MKSDTHAPGTEGRGGVKSESHAPGTGGSEGSTSLKPMLPELKGGEE